MKNYYFKMLVVLFVIGLSTNNLLAQTETEIWKGNCRVIYDYSHELEFSVLLQKPGGTGTNKKALLNLLGKFKLESAPALKNQLVTIIAMINKSKPFKAVYGDADVTISDDLSKKIHELFDGVKIVSKTKGIDCDK
jgi:hypothetical protein